MNIIEMFLAHHKRGCPANVGRDCNCYLPKARAELERLIDRDLQLTHYEIAEDPEIRKRVDEVAQLAERLKQPPLFQETEPQ